MDGMIPIGWMRLGLRAQICTQCRPEATEGDATLVVSPSSCETRCALFVQLPRLANMVVKYRAKPPSGYEDFVHKLLSDSADISDFEWLRSHPEARPGPFLNFSTEAMAILEQIALLFTVPETAGHDCTRRSLALGQLSILSRCSDK